MKRLVQVVVALCLSMQLYAQTTFLPLRHEDYNIIDRLEIMSGSLSNQVHTVNKPMDRKGMAKFISYIDTATETRLTKTDIKRIDQFYMQNWEWASQGEEMKSKKPLFKVLYKNPAYLYHVNTPHFKAMINPVFQFSLGMEPGGSDGLRFVNTRGAELRGKISNIFGFYTFLGENQARFPDYVGDYVKRTKAVPGAGYYKNFKTNGYDYFIARGYVTADIKDFVNFQFGYDKNFIGHGYRSMFLSDFSNDYLFLKVSTRVWKVNYQSIFMELIGEYRRRGVNQDRLLPKKYAAIHHLSFDIGKNFNLGFFESVVFSRDKFELQYLNPIIFYRAIEQAIGSPDNAMLGVDFKANIAKRFSLYGQLLIDDFNFNNEFRLGQEDKSIFKQLFNSNKWWATKIGGQLGFKYINAFEIKNLDYQFEANYGRPFLYSHKTAATAWGHYDQPLAHPLGANFTEMVNILRYQPRTDMIFNFKYVHAKFGRNTDLNFGADIFRDDRNFNSETGNSVHQGIFHKLNHVEARFTYMPWPNINLDATYVMRREKIQDSPDDNTNYFSIGTRINMPYRSYDF